MPDDFTVPDTGQPVPVEVAAPKKGNTGLVIALGALAVVVVVGVVVYLLMTFVFQSTSNQVEVRVPEGQTTQQGTSSTAATGSADAAATPAPAVSNDEVFTFRDIFAPLAGAVSSTTTTTATEDTSDTVDVSDNEDNTLYIVAIGTDNGVQYADIAYGKQVYSHMKAGDVIPDTPWKVLEVRTSEVVMLYGDQQVVLSVGQGITK